MSDKAQWQEVDADSLQALDHGIAEQYEHYRTLRRQAGEAKGEFEKRMQIACNVPAGKRMIFGYNFGKLSVAIVDDDRKPAASAKPKLSLAEFMAQQAASGRAC